MPFSNYVHNLRFAQSDAGLNQRSHLPPLPREGFQARRGALFCEVGARSHLKLATGRGDCGA